MKYHAIILLLLPLILGATSGPTIQSDLDDADYVVVGIMKKTNERFHFHTARGDANDLIHHYKGGRILSLMHVEEWDFTIPPSYKKKYSFSKPESQNILNPAGIEEIVVLYDENDSRIDELENLWVWTLKRNPFSREYYAKPMPNVDGHQRKQIEEYLTMAKEYQKQRQKRNKQNQSH